MKAKGFALLCALIVSLCTGAAGAADSTFTFKRELVLRGLRPAASETFYVDTLEEAAARLHVALRASSVLNRKKSTLAVTVDGRVIDTQWLSRLRHGGNGELLLSISLGKLSKGYHTVRFDGILEVDDDPCLEHHNDAAWLRVLPEGEISWVPDGVRSATFEDMVRRWQSSKQVELVPPGDNSPPALAAVLEAYHLAAALGPKLVLTPTKANAPRLVLRVQQGGEQKTADPLRAVALTKLSEVPAAAAVVEVVEDTLYVEARDAGGLGDALAQLRHDRTRRMCNRPGPCLLTRGISRTKTKEGKRKGAVVLTLADVGHATGWQAEGPGRHTLRLSWGKPGWWTVDRNPLLELWLRRPSSGPLDLKRSTLSVRLEGKALATYRLDRLSEDAAAVRIRVPEELARLGRWGFSLVADLVPVEELRCNRGDLGDAWLVVEGRSQLVVERTEAERKGIASFAASADDARPPLVIQQSLGWQQALVLGQVLTPLARKTPGTRWHLKPKAVPGAVIVREIEGSLKEAVTAAGKSGEHLAAGDGESAIPLLERAYTVRMRHLRNDAGATLEVEVGERVAPETLAAPDLDSLLGYQALWAADSWFSFDEPRTKPDAREVRAKAEPKIAAGLSEEQRLGRAIDVIWAALALLLLLLVIVWMWRRPTGVPNVGTEIEHGTEADGSH